MKGQKELETVLKMKLEEVQEDIDTLEKKFYVKEKINEETFQKFYPQYIEERDKILKILPKPSVMTSNLESHLKRAITFSTELSVVWASGTFSLKERLQKMIFPEGVTYDT